MADFASLGSTLPDIRLAVAFDGTNYTSITDFWRPPFAITRGRQDELGRVTTGTLNSLLDNRTRDFDPNGGGAWAAQLRPMKKVRFEARWPPTTGTVYKLFTGHAEGWPQSYPAYGKDATVPLQASDGFKVINYFDLEGKTYGEQLSSARVQAVLTDIGLTSADWSIQTGQVSVAASGTLGSTTALTHLLDVDRAEGGLLFVNGEGKVVFHDRHYRIKNKGTSALTLGTTGTELRYRDVETQYDDDFLWNVARVTPSGGTAEETTDATSITAYYRRVIADDSLLINANEAKAKANHYVFRYAQPLLRIPSVQPLPQGDDPTTNWPLVLGRELGDRVTVTIRPPGGGTITQAQYIEGISYTINAAKGDFSTTWLLGPVEPYTYWRVGHATYGKIGNTARVGP